MPARKDMEPDEKPQGEPGETETGSRATSVRKREAAEPAAAPQGATAAGAAAQPAPEPAPAGSEGPNGAAVPAPAPAAPAAAAAEPTPITTRRAEYLVVPRSVGPMNVVPADINMVENQLRAQSNVEVVRSIDLAGVSLFSTIGPAPDRAIVAMMSQDTADMLRQRSPGSLIVERNERMYHALDEGAAMQLFDPGIMVPQGSGFQATVVVTGGGQPVAGAQVMLVGSGQTAQAVTDGNGQAVVNILGEDPDTIRGIYVQPAGDFWNLWVPQPAIRTDRPNLVTVTAFNAFGTGFTNFPNQQVLGWGQKAMGLDKVPPDRRGRGIKVAIIDSGLAPNHQDLNHIANGINIVTGNAQGWKVDEIGHGSHCAGIIAARDNGRGIRGFVPDAEVHIIKYFPGGTFAHLVESLAYCIRNQIDVVNMSLGSQSRSDAVEEMLGRAKDAGVCCVVAAGNVPGGGPVQFPGTSPSVLTVAAIGKTGEFPENSWHQNEVLISNAVRATPEGYFSTRFTCFGTEIDLCAPGHAVVSCVPPDNYGAKDGTSMAAPHVTGLAALILAHHPDFQAQGAFRMHSAARINRLLEILKQSSRPIDVGVPQRTGAGMPDTMAALSLAAGTGSAAATPQQDEMLRLLQALLNNMRPQQGTPAAALPRGAQGDATAPASAETSPQSVENVLQSLIGRLGQRAREPSA